jgi:hypothetical protein
VRRYLSRQIAEIAADPALRLYGVALLATHVLTAVWFVKGDRASLVAAGEDAICWPLVPDCERLRVLSAGQLDTAVIAFGAAAIVCALGFAHRRWTGWAWGGLAALTLLKVLGLALDFRLRANQHYMAFAACAVYLLIPHKRESVPLLLVLFYFWAGTLKLNWEWLSGGALYKPLWLLSGRAVVAACAYVVVLELGVVWGLLSRRPWIFWSSLAQVLLFHVMSFAVVGWFYPLLMFALLSLPVLARWFPASPPEPSVGERILSRQLSRSALAMAVAFSLLQLSTHLYPGDTAITGEGRLFALHMFDARVVCEAEATFALADGGTLTADIEIEGGRTRCDPLMLHAVARNLCRHGQVGDVAFTDLALHLRSRRTTESELVPVIEIPEFCTKMPSYSAFLHNDWIRAD